MKVDSFLLHCIVITASVGRREASDQYCVENRRNYRRRSGLSGMQLLPATVLQSMLHPTTTTTMMMMMKPRHRRAPTGGRLSSSASRPDPDVTVFLGGESEREKTLRMNKARIYCDAATVKRFIAVYMSRGLTQCPINNNNKPFKYRAVIDVYLLSVCHF